MGEHTLRLSVDLRAAARRPNLVRARVGDDQRERVGGELLELRDRRLLRAGRGAAD